MKVAIETNAIIESIKLGETKRQIKRQYGSQTIYISSKAKGEAINVIQEDEFGYNEEDAINEVEDIIEDIGAKIIYCEQKDREKGNKLEEKYEDDSKPDLHWPDSMILAHYLREDMDLFVTKDGELRKVSRKEGLDAENLIDAVEERMNQIF